MQSPTLVLASSSPRRRDLLVGLGVTFTALAPRVDERQQAGETAAHIVSRLAQAKAIEVLRRFPDGVVLGADTLVNLDGLPLGKPGDATAARLMLQRLRGRRHEVLTSVCVATTTLCRANVVMTGVTMRDYSDAEIEASSERGTPFDKAGGYAIQDGVFAPVAAIDGCYCNVVGLPLGALRALLREVCGGDVLTEARWPNDRCDHCPCRATLTVEA